MRNKYGSILTEEFLYNEYVKNRRSALSISREVGCNNKTVCSYLEYYGITLQKPMYENRKMSSHAGWHGFGEISRTQYNNIRNNANQRNIPYDLTIEQLWQIYLDQDRKCALSGVEIGFVHHRKGNASLDRINSQQGYVPGNVWWVHKDVNLAKQSLSADDFIALCRRVVAHSDQGKTLSE